MQSSPRHRSADHAPVAVVNRDASRSFAGRDNGGHARHAEADRDGSPGSAGRRRVERRFWPDGRTPRRSKYDHDHSGCRSPPERGNARRETAAPGWDRPRCTDRAVDDGRGKSCDIAPACVPRHGVVHGAEAEPASWARRRACHLSCGPDTVGASEVNPPPPPMSRAMRLQPRITLGLHAKVKTSPDLRGFQPPSTSRDPLESTSREQRLRTAASDPRGTFAPGQRQSAVIPLASVP